jgi:hypothetical protein
MFRTLLYAVVAVVGYVVGYRNSMIPGGGPEDQLSPVGYAGLILVSAFFAVAMLLKTTRIPLRALQDIDQERRADPNGRCSIRVLRPAFTLMIAFGIGILCCAGGQYVRRVDGKPAGAMEFTLFGGLGFSLGVGLCWNRLKLGSREGI